MGSKSISYKKLQAGDDQEFYNLVLLFNTVFESPHQVNMENIHRLLKKPSFVCYVALKNDEVVGGISAYELEMYDQPGSALYIYDLAVHHDYQRTGIGSKLMKEVMDYSKRNGIQTVFVQAEEEDQHAITFYQKIGGEPTKTCHFNFDLSD